MGFRFRKSIKLAPGMRVNFSKRGASLSLGSKHGRITAGTSGVRVSASIPGTGLSYQTRLGSTTRASVASSRRTSSPPAPVMMAIALQVDDDTGELSIHDARTRTRVTPQVAQSIMTQHKALILSTLEDEAARREADRAEVAGLHLHAAQLAEQVGFEPLPAPVLTLPDPPVHPLVVRAFGSVFSRTRKLIEADHLAYQERCAALQAAHDMASQEHSEADTWRRRRFDESRQGLPDAMEDVFEEVLSRLTWPYETLVAFEVPDPRVLVFDVDLPEIEDLPQEEAKVSKRPLGLKFKALSQTNLRRQYMQHVHAIGFVLTTLAFARLPTIDTVILSGYSQRPDPKTANLVDTYLYSARIARERFDAIDMSRLDALDVVACFERFELRRNMTQTGIFKPIEPFSAESES